MKTIKQFIYLSSLVLLSGASSCIDDIMIKGNGIQASEARIVSVFEKVKSSGSFEVHVTQGDETNAIISADENLLQYIETSVSDNTLNIDIRGTHSVQNRLPMEIFITTPVLEGVKLSGSGIITTDYFKSNEMDVILSGSGIIKTAFDANKADVLISGSGKVELSGNVNKADLKISGSGNIDALDLLTKDCDTATSGSGDMWISVDRLLDAKISGSGNVFFSGESAVESHISGSGKIIRNN